MNREQIKERCRNIKYDLAKGEQTFSMCRCGRHGSRMGKCWECNLDELFYNKLDALDKENGQ